MRLIVAGSRTFDNYDELEQLLDNTPDISAIVCGMAKGADLLGKKWADKNNIPVHEFPADWNKYGKRAGHLRNWEMAKNADAIIIFWDGKSPGSRSMLSIADQMGLEGVLINYIDKTYKKINLDIEERNTLY